MPDPALGRVGYVIDGFGLGADTYHERRCNGCRKWNPASDHGCECGYPCPCPVCSFNKEIRTKQMNNQLYRQAGLRSG